ncbi:hypothetical protein ABZ752_13220 [Streptomyces roseifaciens]
MRRTATATEQAPDAGALHAEIAFDDSRQMSGEDLGGVRGEPVESDHCSDGHVAHFDLHVLPGVGEVLPRVLSHCADHCLSGFAGLLADLEDLKDPTLFDRKRAVIV